MNRSARNLLSISVLAPVVAALAVAAAPANAAPGPSTALLYDAATAAAPVTRTLPDPVLNTVGQTAEQGTGTVDGVLRAAPAASTLRAVPAAPGLGAGNARCTLNPGKTVNSKAGTSLPRTPLQTAGRSPLGGLPEGDCLGAAPGTGRRAALPVPSDAAGRVPRTLLNDVGKVGTSVHNSKLGELGGAPLPSGRRAGMPLSMAVPGLTDGLPDVPSTLGSASPGGLPVGAALFPPAGRIAAPEPSDDLVGQANDTVNQAGAGVGETEENVGSVVDVLKAKDRAGRPADGPLSMPSAPGLGLPDLPGIG
ncbi:hypothetical protein E1293_17750 [Actinomadura darangshiensis]|uniref:ATP-binding protein n=1 Tax=Actinomadura darangshiensis TaxID=705336 RepID=A0A4R5B9K4_9ACTN|nr:hypothetical protein [Actinomadura darangshiensis]TDD81843.1 hypothetical protein E1293_17750 [Actinomadura darangshiensis]